MLWNLLLSLKPAANRFEPRVGDGRIAAVSETTIYRTRKILTMNPRQPHAEAVAVRDGRILAVGPLEEVRAWPDGRMDDRFAERVLMPGLVEGHAHTLEGGFWEYCYVGYYDRVAPDGTAWKGLESIDDVVARLKKAERQLPDAETPLMAWGFDPILFGGRRMTLDDLDAVSTSRPVIVIHASIHNLNTNSAGLALAGLGPDSPVDGLLRDENGRPTGELMEFAAMFLVFDAVDIDLFALGSSETAVRNYARVANLKGVTTITDLINDLAPATVEAFSAVTASDDCPIRLISALNGFSAQPEQAVEKMRALQARNSERLRFQVVKLMTDGAIQGFTARLKWPGYFNGAPNGLWNTTPEQLEASVRAVHKGGFQLHIHTNGNEASELALDVLEKVLSEHPRPDHRHTLQHAQMADAAQFRRMAKLGTCVNLFANHIYFWGDIHYTVTLGPERAHGLNAVATAARSGVPFAIHSDAPVTPLGPLFTAWCAVNRRTSGGRTLGENERIGVADALRAITLGAAYTLKLDGEIGSLEVGKRADFAVLDDDPEALEPEELCDVRVAGTVLGGRWFPAPGQG